MFYRNPEHKTFPTIHCLRIQAGMLDKGYVYCYNNIHLFIHTPPSMFSHTEIKVNINSTFFHIGQGDNLLINT